MRPNELSLLEIQKIFAAAVSVKKNNDSLEFIVENGLVPARRLQVYRNNIIHNFTEALRATYPLVERLVGEEFFAAMALEYIQQYPSQQADLHQYGFYFVDFLKTFVPAQTIAYLSEVAQFEWGYHEVFHAAFHPQFNLEKLNKISPDNYGDLRFILHPAARLFAFRYPISIISQICQEDSGENVTLPDQGEYLLMMRPELEVTWKILSAGEHALLATCVQGKNFALACENALTAQPDFIVADGLQYHLAKNTIVDFTL